MSTPKSRVRFIIKCKDLVNKDLLSKSDPMVIVNLEGKGGNFSYIGQTEWIQDNVNPEFQTKIEMDYTFEQKQNLRFIVIDVDDPKKIPTSYVPNSKEGDLLGMAETTMSAIVGGRGSQATLPLKAQRANKDYGTITVLAEEIKEGARSTDELFLHIRCRDLARKDHGPLGKSDPYLVFTRKRADGVEEDVHKTEIIKRDLNPSFRDMRINVLRLCNGHLDAYFRITCWDYDSMSSPDLIGHIDTCVGELLTKRELALVDPKGKGKPCGFLTPDKAFIYRLPSFLDYITTGCEITLTVAIDFTLSNGAPTEPSSLHHMRTDGGWNAYQQAIIAVSEVLLPYDHDKRICALGYGAVLPNSAQEKASFCFALNGNTQDPEVDGVQGLLDAYAMSLQNVQLYGPTNMSEIVKRANTLAQEKQKKAYQVLMILTDGDISDMPATVDAIVASSSLPMSIVIVGVHNREHVAEFQRMEELDGDRKGLVDSSGRKASRDIVQFVPYSAEGTDPEALARSVLAEIPSQLVSHFAGQQVKPACWQGTGFELFPTGELSRLMASVRL
mmetsp:Transcript_46909/g.114263  ORF Transcript_46909/g.114263 Transcript_46909/m.114263 type:complete len:557 (+) Transcript_46909:148-1818(+)|eukprot:CAMPEP_0206231648 /NCGR_PEP_ID=MMETSP0047_2-20121206/10960_1 /ASSEMBLY_ACC=CAM_ASM_000192 /TAXON_ID=195065 /ORGANISM="Chroomonas mesostigmatica_cf, Strain CCMP1168" /LENGTH=556 /DNA_ID=CAMNT_0053655263 /DNA_START=148 /DNA_END=1818 /DNA_ORIENTATION=-